MNVDKKYLSLAAVCLGLVVFISIMLGLISRVRHSGDAAQSVAASEDPSASGVPVTAAQPAGDPSSPALQFFGAAQNDPDGFDGHAWSATVADVAGRRGKAEPGFTVDAKGYNGPLDLPTIIWRGIGLPPNHKQAQADTFDPASLQGTEFNTIRRGRAQYIFANGHFAMAIVGVDANRFLPVQQKLASDFQEIPSLRTEQTFDLADAGSGLPPDTIATECFRKPNTNTRIYLIEKWSSNLLGAVTYHRVFVVYIPNSSYITLLKAATQPAQTTASARP